MLDLDQVRVKFLMKLALTMTCALQERVATPSMHIPPGGASPLYFRSSLQEGEAVARLGGVEKARNDER
jgi:hypothetical protein